MTLRRLGISLNPTDGLGLPIIKDEDRFKHFYLLGATRAGKTSVFLSLIHSEIDKGAMIVLDPVGELAELVSGFAPPERLLYVDKNHPITINPLKRKELSKTERVNELIEVINASVQSFASHQMEVTVKMARITRNAVKVFSEDELNLRYLSDFLDSPAVREDHFKTHPRLFNLYWKEFDYRGYKYDQLRASAERVSDRLSLLADDDTLQHFINGPNQFDIKEIVNDRRIVVFNLDRLDDEVVSFIGNLVSHAIKNYYRHQATTKSPPLFFYADEFHLFITPFFKKLLTGAGKFNISLNFSHHNHSQIPPAVLDVALGNCYTRMVLRCGKNEAKRMAEEFQINTSEIMNLEKYEAYAAIGKEVHYIRTFPPPKVEPYTPPEQEKPEPEPEQPPVNFLRSGYFPV